MAHRKWAIRNEPKQIGENVKDSPMHQESIKTVNQVLES